MNTMDKNDYTDPRCPFDFSQYTGGPKETVPVRRILEKEDSFLAVNDYEGARRHLAYWIAEAKTLKDVRGAFSLLNELMGVLRKSGKKEEAIRTAGEALALTADPDITGDPVGTATCLINAGTVLTYAERPEDAVPLFEMACGIYEKVLPEKDARLGGLYNNMALSKTDTGDYNGALQDFRKALSVMGSQDQGAKEQAVTYLNMADLYELRDGAEGAEAIDRCVSQAEECLESKKLLHDADYAFVLEKCAPVFDYYGHFYYAEVCRTRAAAIRAAYGKKDE